jgi:hypothetical protein
MTVYPTPRFVNGSLDGTDRSARGTPLEMEDADPEVFLFGHYRQHEHVMGELLRYPG